MNIILAQNQKLTPYEAAVVKESKDCAEYLKSKGGMTSKQLEKQKADEEEAAKNKEDDENEQATQTGSHSEKKEEDQLNGDSPQRGDGEENDEDGEKKSSATAAAVSDKENNNRERTSDTTSSAGGKSGKSQDESRKGKGKSGKDGKHKGGKHSMRNEIQERVRIFQQRKLATQGIYHLRKMRLYNSYRGGTQTEKSLTKTLVTSFNEGSIKKTKAEEKESLDDWDSYLHGRPMYIYYKYIKI